MQNCRSHVWKLVPTAADKCSVGTQSGANAKRTTRIALREHAPAAFGIKPNHLNDYEKSSYANSEAQQLAFYTDTMLYILKQYEEELNFKLLSEKQVAAGFRFKFNLAAVLRGDTKTQVESLSKGISSGLYTPDEARRNLDLPSKPGGDKLYFNGSNIPIELAGSQYAALPEKSEEKMVFLLAKAFESAIISINKYSDSQPRDDHGRWTDGGGGSGGSSGGGRSSGSQEEPVQNPGAGKTEQVGTVDFSDKKAVMSRLAEAEKEFSDLPYEKCCTITSDGKVWYTTGTSATVDDSEIENMGSSLEGCYSYHNHPANETYFSFSGEDAGSFISRGEAVSVASDYKYRYFMERTNSTVTMDYRTVQDRFNEIRGSTVLEIAFTRNESTFMDLEGYHETMKILAQEYSFQYRRVLK